MNIFTLRNKFSSFLKTALMVMAFSMMTACSSSDDPVEDDAAAADAAAAEQNCRDTHAGNLPEMEACIQALNI